MLKHTTLKKISLICLMLVAGWAMAEFNVKDWQYCKPVENPGGGAAGYAGITVDREIFAGAKSDLSDLRIINNQFQETPYKVFVNAQSAQETDVLANMFNRSFVPAEQTVFTMDLGQDITQRRNNSLRIETKEQNFRNRVELRASNDQQTWYMLRNDCYIFDFTTNDYKSAYTAMEYPENDYRYIKVSIMGQGPNPFDVSRATVHRKLSKDAEEYYLADIKIISRTANSVLKAGELIVDTGSIGQPNYRMELKPTGENYHRRVEVLGADELVPPAPKDKRTPPQTEVYWNSLGSGYIYDFNTAQLITRQGKLGYRENGYRYLKVLVYNYDDRPLEFPDGSVKVAGAVRRIVFDCKTGAGYTIYYGNNWALRPVYDIEKLLPYMGAVRLNELSLGKEAKNARYLNLPPERPWSERNAVLMWVVVIVAILVMGYAIVKWSKSIKPEEQ